MTETTTRTHRKGTAPMHRIDGGVLLQGSADFYPEEQPVREVEVASIWVDEHPVTNAEFRRFVKETDHVTVAERDPDPADFPDARPDQLVAGSLVFTPTPGPVPLDDWHRWWRWQPGADWRHPEGPESTLHGREKHPVVHIAYEDAKAYAAWAGKRLPTESEWEWAARGGLVAKTYAWGDEFMPKNRVMANTWHGEFPWRNDRAGKNGLTSPVGSYAPNGYGLFDMAGNVWEWTDSPWTFSHSDEHVVESSSCCSPSHLADESNRMVSKGGSHLCAPSYCHRYRPAARQGHAIRSSTGHLGFRCFRSVD
ncbi:formylglycine-generating enzyme family protein [Solicola gregarius]|uniref:Formylglycine-generating enzyme family protein n=1 Tax=Solicola gregarius TaxID=2908642 RepID=A0AA46TDV9_9ACTN|nr:formylglycine-generating enzyme family protein [Solicola gregarius]UYM03519.1 formylglycine-generating enzyme family protein [Solicola gregarius]